MFAATPASPGRTVEMLREEMVATLVEKGVACSPEIIEALRTVPRHLIDGVDAERVYDPFRAAVTKRGADGVSLSSVSAAHVQVMQLEQAGVRAGHRVLEIGSGGVNAAYLAELVGESGLVVSMDIDPDVTARAQRFLAKTGHQQVVVVTGDAAFGAPQSAPFDLILVTVETTDVPEAWWDQLAGDGKIVACVRWRGQSRTVTLARQDKDLLVADDLAQCGFVPMQGLGEDRQRLVVLHDVPDQRVALRLDEDTPLDVDALSRALVAEKTFRWTGVRLPKGESYELLDLWLATVLDTAVMTGDPGAQESGLIPSPSPIGWPVLVAGPNLAYRTLRATDDPQLWELGVIGHGPGAGDLADRYTAAITSWDPRARPRLTVTRHTPPAVPGLTRRSVHRRTSTFTISWS